MSYWVPVCYCFLTISLVPVLATNTNCPTWHYYYNSTGACECGSFLSCSNDKVEIRIDHCATALGRDGDYFIGFCPFPNTVNNSNRMSSEMPSNASQLDEVMCGPYNRRGLLCGECKGGYGPAYSLDRKCAKCSNVWSGFTICLYLIVEFVPARPKVTHNPIPTSLFCFNILFVCLFVCLFVMNALGKANSTS